MAQESKLETRCWRWAVKEGWETLKIEGLNKTGKPDRVFMRDGPVTVWVEFKKPGEKPTQKQYWWLRRLRRMGYTADWCDNFEDFKTTLNNSY